MNKEKYIKRYGQARWEDKQTKRRYGDEYIKGTSISALITKIAYKEEVSKRLKEGAKQ